MRPFQHPPPHAERGAPLLAIDGPQPHWVSCGRIGHSCRSISRQLGFGPQADVFLCQEAFRTRAHAEWVSSQSAASISTSKLYEKVTLSFHKTRVGLGQTIGARQGWRQEPVNSGRKHVPCSVVSCHNGPHPNLIEFTGLHSCYHLCLFSQIGSSPRANVRRDNELVVLTGCLRREEDRIFSPGMNTQKFEL